VVKSNDQILHTRIRNAPLTARGRFPEDIVPRFLSLIIPISVIRQEDSRQDTRVIVLAGSESSMGRVIVFIRLFDFQAVQYIKNKNKQIGKEGKKQRPADQPEILFF